MLQTQPPFKTQLKQDGLVTATEQLRLALDAYVGVQDLERTGPLGEALGRVENALRLHRKASEVSDGVFAAIDETRPTQVNEADALCNEQSALLREVEDLQSEVLRAAADGPAGLDEKAVRLRVEQLLVGLRKLDKAETELILDSVNTDIGVGD